MLIITGLTSGVVFWLLSKSFLIACLAGILPILGYYFIHWIKPQLTYLVDKLKPFKEYRDRQEKMEKWIDRLFQGRTIDECSKLFNQVLDERFDSSKIGVYVKELKENKERYNPKGGGKNFQSADYALYMFEDNIELLKSGKILIREELQNSDVSESEKIAAQVMVQDDYEIQFPVMADGKLLAAIALGSKPDRRVYNDVDFADIASLAQAFGCALRGLIIQQKMKQYTAAWAHDLNSPFSKSNVMGYLSAAIQEEFGKISAELKEILEHVYDSLLFPAEHIQELFNPESALRQIKPKFKEELLAQSFQDVKRHHRGVLSVGKIEMILELPPSDFKCEYDKLLIDRRVLGNIVANAIRHTPPFGRVTLSAEIKADEVILRVHNTGSYIAEDERETIFEEGAQSASFKKGDAGLGLFNVRQMLELHGGKVWAESDKESGTTFFCTLPLKLEKNI